MNKDRSHLIDKLFGHVIDRDYGFDKANLEFLNAIEENQREMIALLKDYPASIKQVVDQLKEVLQRPEPDDKPAPENKIDLGAIIEPILSLQNSFTMKMNQIISEITRHNTQILNTNNELLSALKRPKKWKMTPDRNSRTKLIQEVTIEQVD